VKEKEKEAKEMKKSVGLWVTFVLALVLSLSATAFGQALTKEKPIRINEKEKSISFLADVNGKYFLQPTRHGVVFRDGKNGDKSIFRAFAEHKSFYESLATLGFKAGNNMTMENRETTYVQGDLLDVTITWKGAKKEYRLDEVVKDSNGKPLLIRFGGNLSNAIQYNTGCLICLDSCPVGITSNASYTNGAVENRKEVAFTGIKEVLPPDGTLVTFTVKGKK
jgi:hypothetical protein